MDNFYNSLPIIVQSCNKALEDYLLNDSTAWRYSPIFGLAGQSGTRQSFLHLANPTRFVPFFFYDILHPVVARSSDSLG